MCESYGRLFDALAQLPTDEYLALGVLLSKKMIEGPPATSRFLTVMAIELMEPVVELHERIRRRMRRRCERTNPQAESKSPSSPRTDDPSPPGSPPTARPPGHTS